MQCGQERGGVYHHDPDARHTICIQGSNCHVGNMHISQTDHSTLDIIALLLYYISINNHVHVIWSGRVRK